MPSDLVYLGSKDLECVFSLPNTDCGVVDFIKNFGSLYIGNMQSNLFKTTFLNLKLKILPWFANLHNIQDNDNYRIGHKIDLCHQALESHWRSPCTATILKEDMQWESGLSRILAGGMCWENPWNQHKLLILSPSIQHITGYLDHAIEITSDSELVEALGSSGIAKINTSLYLDVNKQLFFRLGSVQKKVGHREYMQDLSSRVDVVRHWVTKYPIKSKLNLYTDRPDLVKDSIGFWDIQHKGPGYVFSPKSSIDSHLWQQANLFDSQTTDDTHELFVQNLTHTIDAAELLVWMDMSYSSYYTKDWNFVLQRKSNMHRAKLIGLSRNC